MSIKIILFDAVGVLFPVNTVVGDDLGKRFHLTEEQLAKMWKGFYPDYAVGKLSTDEFLDTFAATYNLPRQEVTKEVFTESFQKALSPMPGMNDILAGLQKSEATLAMLSDTSEMFADARRSWLFSEYFDHIFLSFEIGYKKPDIHAFQAVTDYYKIRPDEVFFIDDNLGNVKAATKYGMTATAFTDAKALIKKLEDIGILL